MLGDSTPSIPLRGRPALNSKSAGPYSRAITVH
jgi:hypothetical protein